MAVALVAAASLTAYLPTLRCGFTNFDDPEHVTSNPLVRRPGLVSLARFFREVRQPSTVRGYYKPLTMTSLMIDAWLSGPGEPKAWIFHLTNVLLHVGSAALVVLIVASAVGSWPAALLVGLIFGLHPLNVEAVAWIAQRKSTLSVFFSLLSVLAHIRGARSSRPFWYPLKLTSFLLALLAKPSVVMLPLMMLALDYWPLGRLSWRAVARLAPLLVLAALFTVITAVSHGPSMGQPYVLPQISLASTLLVPAHNVVFYLRKVVWPAGLSPFYPYPHPISLTSPAYLAGLLGSAAVVAVVVWSWRRLPPLAVGLAWFGLALLPVLGLVRFTHVIAADRFAYLPMVGLLLTLAAGLKALLARRPVLPLAAAAMLGLAAMLGARTYRQCHIWKDGQSLWQHALATSPDAGFVRACLGDALIRAGQVDQALPHLRRAVQLEPKNALANYNLAVALERAGDISGAIRHYRRTIELIPQHSWAHCNLGRLLQRRGQVRSALSHFDQAIAAEPAFVPAYYNKGIVLKRLGMLDQAIQCLQTVVRLDPTWDVGHYNLAVMLDQNGSLPQAADHYRRAIRANPDHLRARYNLAVLLLRQGRQAEAVRQLRQILARQPGHELARRLLGQIIAAQRR